MSPRRLILIILLLAITGLGVLGERAYRIVEVGSGYYAKILCSGVFVSGRPADEVIAQDVLVDQTSLLELFSADIDTTARQVHAAFLGMVAGQTAVYRDGLGCTLAIGRPLEEVRNVRLAPSDNAPAPHQTAGREGDAPLAATDFETDAPSPALERALDEAFAEPQPDALKRTRALVVVQGGRIVAERYAPGFDAQTPQLGWSMSKSVTNALAGALVARGLIDVSESGLLPEWTQDEKARITLDDLLRMRSGLAFDEDYAAALSDVRVMLFATGDKSAFAANKPMVCAPDRCWSYSSGTTNIVNRILGRVAQDAGIRMEAMASELLFGPLGMTTAVFETDAAGVPVGSSYVYASARDWARLGLLYLRRGEWHGQRIFTQDWYDYTIIPTEGSPSQFAAHVWRKAPRPPGREDDPENQVAVPEDAIFFLGHDGQMVAVVPSRDAVIVRLGLSRKAQSFDHAALVASVLAALPERATEARPE
jgi:CubicO group peptidase (beta-lactamase class C family)